MRAARNKLREARSSSVSSGEKQNLNLASRGCLLVSRVLARRPWCDAGRPRGVGGISVLNFSNLELLRIDWPLKPLICPVAERAP